MRFRVWIAAIVWAVVLAISAAAQDRTAAPPERVVIGAYVNDIQAIDLRTHAFSIDLYIWFRWKRADIDPGKSFEFMNMVDPDNRVLTRIYEEPLTQPDGSKYLAYRYVGSFSSKFPIASYPFDTQVLRIHIEDSDRTVDEQRYAWDALTLNPAITLPGYRIGTPRVIAADYPYPTAFGDLSRKTNEVYSRVTVEIPITRPWISGAVKTLLPVALIVLCATAGLLLGVHRVEARIGLAITALLSLVALQFSAASSLPDVGYLIMLDQIFILSYLFILVIIGSIVRGARRADRVLARTGESSSMRPSVGLSIVMLAAYILGLTALLVLNVADEPGLSWKTLLAALK